MECKYDPPLLGCLCTTCAEAMYSTRPFLPESSLATHDYCLPFTCVHTQSHIHTNTCTLSVEHVITLSSTLTLAANMCIPNSLQSSLLLVKGLQLSLQDIQGIAGVCLCTRVCVYVVGCATYIRISVCMSICVSVHCTCVCVCVYVV